ncbi:MAG: hypothetical protein HY051_02790 [Candidatus Aenigmarchaeota archaeon]|nr:hypothetical protein [Candidatus Aenigmarchaeota archaeon]
MPTGLKIPDSMVEEWADLERRYSSTGMSRAQIHKSIANIYGVRMFTVYRRLTPGYLEERRRKDRVEELTPEARARRLQSYRKYRDRPGVQESRQAYIVSYLKIRPLIDSMITELFEQYQDSPTLPEDIAKAVFDQTGINLRLSTIARQIERLFEGATIES